ncbi:MAG: M2 family metallopeptidase, partial [Bryobacteraceae bacterium]
MKRILVLLAVLAAPSCRTAPTVEEARQFLERAERELLELSNEASRAAWVQSTYITLDTEALAAKANERLITANVRLAKEASRYEKLPLPDDMQR